MIFVASIYITCDARRVEGRYCIGTAAYIAYKRVQKQQTKTKENIPTTKVLLLSSYNTSIK
jgi:hypothetical protein